MAWITILRKRENFRQAFEGFDFRRVAQYGEADIERLMGEPGIVRNRAKIVSAINNARRACELVERLARWRAGCGRSNPAQKSGRQWWIWLTGRPIRLQRLRCVCPKP